MHIAIVGDIKHSRVARSNVLGLHRARRRGHAGRPADAAARRASTAGRSTVTHDLDAVLPKVDVVYLLRMQRERMTEALLPSLREYTAALRPHPRRGPRLLADDALVMHPGPMNRGVEIAADVADLPNVGDHRAGRQRRRRAHGRAVPPARLGRDLDAVRPHELRDPGRDGRRRRPARAAPTSLIARRRDRRGRRRTSTRRRPCSTPAGCVVAPGLVDLHTHLRQPGREEAETIETGARAAALGGFTAVVAMPNTEPAMDSAGGRPRGARARAPGALCDVRVGRRHHRRPQGRAAGADGRDGRRSGCGSSPTTAPACRTPG